MMNIGKEFIPSENGLVTSLAWGMKGEVSYVFEGNLNYTGAVITWLKDEVQLISSPGEPDRWRNRRSKDTTILCRHSPDSAHRTGIQRQKEF